MWVRQPGFRDLRDIPDLVGRVGAESSQLPLKGKSRGREAQKQRPRGPEAQSLTLQTFKVA